MAVNERRKRAGKQKVREAPDGGMTQSFRFDKHETENSRAPQHQQILISV
jgi:hypothetical protein